MDRQTVAPSVTAINGGQFMGMGSSSSSKFFKKKSSNISLLTASYNHGNDFNDPFEQSGDISPRKIDAISSSSGHSTRSSDLGSEVVSSSATTASGQPHTGAGSVAAGGTDELDQGCKARGHISLGRCNYSNTCTQYV